MKKIYSLFLLVALLCSCSGVETPPNNALDKGHEEADSIVVVFTPGNLEKTDIDNGVYATGFTPKKDGVKQTLFFKNQSNADIKKKDNVSLKKGEWYKMQIHFFNKAKQRIEDQFIRNEEQRNMHQFYFQYRVEGNAIVDKEKIGFDYRYGDTFDGINNLIKPAIGFFGYIRVKDNAPDHFGINMILVHVVPPGIKTMQSGKPYPFYDAPLEQLGVQDINLNVNVTSIN